mgnify:FL=1
MRVAVQMARTEGCPVYDTAQVDGRYCLSMEYIDGEDLSAVLRRMGRPSNEKAIDIARQLCAGLAAAHANNVLHRDLKPANVMIDGRGRVRITDFGLAGLADSFGHGEIRAGTPAYMAPEQLNGKEVSSRSDIYALGLVLYEVFTGKRLFESNSVAELQRLHDSGSRATPSSVVDDIDPAVERVITRCLEKEPGQRPASALLVAASLPGGDPLAAALAAGETPSPEMVAAAGSHEGVHPALALSCLVLIVGGILAIGALTASSSLARLVPLPKSPEVLADRAAEIVKKLGHGSAVADTAFGFESRWDYLEHVKKSDKSVSRWEGLASVRPAPIYFWHRQSPRSLLPAASEDRISEHEPPMDVSGMSLVKLDPGGRLIFLRVVPPERIDEATTGASGEVNPTDWSVRFSEAQIDERLFTPTAPRWMPESYCDERAAWEGRFDGQPDVPIRLEAGAYRGEPTFFRIIEPWTKPYRMEEEATTTGDYVAQFIILGVLTLLVVGGVFMARRNLRLRRADRTGANRLAISFFCILSVSWLLISDHVPATFMEFFRIRYQLAMAMMASAVVWLWYVSLEPYVRRRSPHVLISWSRLLAGRLRDPLVGRDILLGGLFALCHGAVWIIGPRVSAWLGEAPDVPGFWAAYVFLGPRFQIGEALSHTFTTFFSLLLLFLFLGTRLLLRRLWLTLLVLLILNGALGIASDFGETTFAAKCLGAATTTAWFGIHLVALLRFGLLVSVFTWFFDFLFIFPSVYGLAGWQSEASWVAMIFVAAILGYGCAIAMAGRPILRDELAEG